MLWQRRHYIYSRILTALASSTHVVYEAYRNNDGNDVSLLKSFESYVIKHPFGLELTRHRLINFESIRHIVILSW